ncbi:MAG: YlxR family protein [Streptosporangiaceae bacterium]
MARQVRPGAAGALGAATPRRPATAAQRAPCPVSRTRRHCKVDDIVARRTASPTRPAWPASARPIRTCVGCGVSTAKSDLLRLVARGNEIVPDAAARLTGRGAYLHPSQDCLARAQRRRAIPRALRLSGPASAGAGRAGTASVSVAGLVEYLGTEYPGTAGAGRAT